MACRTFEEHTLAAPSRLRSDAYLCIFSFASVFLLFCFFANGEGLVCSDAQGCTYFSRARVHLHGEAARMKQPMRARRKAMRAVAQHRKRSCARIDAANRALAYAMRKPRDHGKKRSWSYIAQHVKKTDGSHPSVRALQRIVEQWPRGAKKRGRKKEWRKPSPEDDNLILEKFHELRPPGHGIDARSLRAALPTPLKNRVRFLLSLPFLFTQTAPALVSLRAVESRGVSQNLHSAFGRERLHAAKAVGQAPNETCAGKAALDVREDTREPQCGELERASSSCW